MNSLWLIYGNQMFGCKFFDILINFIVGFKWFELIGILYWCVVYNTITINFKLDEMRFWVKMIFSDILICRKIIYIFCWTYYIFDISLCHDKNMTTPQWAYKEHHYSSFFATKALTSNRSVPVINVTDPGPLSYFYLRLAKACQNLSFFLAFQSTCKTSRKSTFRGLASGNLKH